MAAADYYVTVSGAGNNSGDSWANAMAASDFITDLTTNAEAGDRYFLEDGTYTLSASVTIAASGNDDENIHIIGVASGTTAEPPTSSDWASGTGRPLISQGSYQFIGTTFNIFRNLRFSGSPAGHLVTLSTEGQAHNCKFTHSVASGAYYALSTGSLVRVVNCEFDDAPYSAIYSNSSGLIFGCLFGPNSGPGQYGAAYLVGAGVAVLNNIFNGCDTGIGVRQQGQVIVNNTFYDCTDEGIRFNDSNEWSSTVLNNIFHTCGVAVQTASGGDDCEALFNDYNHFYNCTIDYSTDTGSTEHTTLYGPNDTKDTDPNFTTNGSDFSLQSGSVCIDAGKSMELGVG